MAPTVIAVLLAAAAAGLFLWSYHRYQATRHEIPSAARVNAARAVFFAAAFTLLATAAVIGVP